MVWRSIVISRNCSQNSGSTVIDVSRPLILTWCRQLSFQRCLSHCCRRHLTSNSQSEMATRACWCEIPSDAGSFGHISEFPNQFFCNSRVVGFWRAVRRPGKRLRGSAFPNVNLANSRVVLAPATCRLGRAKPAVLSVVKRSELTTMRVSRLAWIALGRSRQGRGAFGTSPWPATKTAPGRPRRRRLRALQVPIFHPIVGLVATQCRRARFGAPNS